MTIPAVRARMVHDSVNELVKKTILGVEDILLHLPQDGERVDVLTNDEQTNVNEIELPVKRNVRVFPLRDVDGMMIEMVLQLQKDSSNEAQNIEVIVECPNYKPNRINIGGTWYGMLQ
ncbi:hypothetical protein Q1695_012443 [Nippostrongylus brasiliensis]|nr:hypothetical protein Q1695_012443 [Nippostrongylus brasiliensis]